MSFIAHMIYSIKHNKRERVSAFEKIKNFKEGINIQVTFNKTATPLELQKIREKLQLENRKSFRINLILFLVLIVIIVYTIGFVKV